MALDGLIIEITLRWTTPRSHATMGIIALCTLRSTALAVVPAKHVQPSLMLASHILAHYLLWPTAHIPLPDGPIAMPARPWILLRSLVVLGTTVAQVLRLLAPALSMGKCVLPSTTRAMQMAVRVIFEMLGLVVGENFARRICSCGVRVRFGGPGRWTRQVHRLWRKRCRNRETIKKWFTKIVLRSQFDSLLTVRFDEYRPVKMGQTCPASCLCPQSAACGQHWGNRCLCCCVFIPCFSFVGTLVATYASRAHVRQQLWPRICGSKSFEPTNCTKRLRSQLWAHVHVVAPARETR